MKLKALLSIVGLTAAFTMTAQAQIITDGDFEAGSDASWSTWEHQGTIGFTFNYTSDGPTGGTGGALRLQLPGDPTNGGIYQQVTLTGGNAYEIDGLVKEVSGSIESTWFELYLSQTEPTDGVEIDLSNNVTRINTWACPGYDGTFVDGCETPANGQFTVPGSGAQTWYLIIKTGVCCGGGAGEYVVDDIVVTDLGSAATFDSPPTPLDEDFDDGDDVNNYGGEYIAFAGGDPAGNFTVQDGSMVAASVDAEGTTGVAGDRALRVAATTPLEGDNFIYYGAIVQLFPNEAQGQDLTSLDVLSFDIKLGDASAPTNWIVRLEDEAADGNTSGNYNFIDLSGLLTTSYTNVEIPLADFVSGADGGGIAPDLSQIDVVAFAVGDVNLLTTNPDIFIDNIFIGGIPVTYDTPPTPLTENFDDGDDRNNYGGEYIAFAGGDPGGVFAVQDNRMVAASVDAEGTTGLAGDRAMQFAATTPLEGLNFTYYGGIVQVFPGEIQGQDISGFDVLSFDIKLGDPAATTNWIVRLEDESADGNNAGSYNFIDLSGILTTSYANVEIPLGDFVNAADGGTIAPDLTQIDVITFAVGDVDAASTNPNIFIDNIYLGPTASSVDNWEMYQ